MSIPPLSRPLPLGADGGVDGGADGGAAAVLRRY